MASKQHTTCNWVQAMEGNIDTSHISHLHQWDGIDDLPDDGSDKPGYPSNAMSWKFWRHDRAPRLEVHDTWFGYRYAGIRTTPNGNTHVRVTAYALPYATMVASIPFSVGCGMFVPIDDENCWRYFSAPKAWRNPRNYGGANLFSLAPFSTPVTNPRNGIAPRLYTAENDYQLSQEVRPRAFQDHLTG
jgi:phthalate 4,5-dioxygenase